jgi:hypothetical protein
MNFSQEGLVEKDTNFIGGYPGVKDSTQKICYRNAKFKIQNIRQAFYKHPHSGTPDPSVPDNN